MKKLLFEFFTLLFATSTSLSFASAVSAESAAKLTVVVDGLRDQNGQVCMRIFSSGQGFPLGDKSEVQSACTKIIGDSVTKQFYGLKPGNYAVAVLHDEIGDHKLGTNVLGIPQEGFGISNNPTISVQTGAPKFEDASFSLTRDTTIKIIMKYSLDE